jgi:tRNA threonylcarbamoyladenosine biosynthesis protein TsaB
MRVLAVDTASVVATAAVIDKDKLICEHVLNHKKTHSEKIMPMIEEILNSSEIDIKDIDIFAAAVGPGSFTGLRIGIAAIKGFAQAIDRPVVGVSTLEGLAYNTGINQYILSPIMDARRNQVYNAIYKWNNNELEEIEAPRALALGELMKEIINNKRQVIFTGDGVDVYKETLLSELGNLCILAPYNQRINRASSIAEIALRKAEKGEIQDYSTFVPFYLRKSQAEQAMELSPVVCPKQLNRRYKI